MDESLLSCSSCFVALLLAFVVLVAFGAFLGGYEKHLPVATEKYGTKFLSGEYADLAASLGAWSVKVANPADVIPAIKEAAAQTFAGRTALVECITCEERQFSLVR